MQDSIGQQRLIIARAVPGHAGYGARLAKQTYLQDPVADPIQGEMKGGSMVNADEGYGAPSLSVAGILP